MTVRQTTEQIVLEIITKGYSETFNALKTKYLSLKATAEEDWANYEDIEEADEVSVQYWSVKECFEGIQSKLSMIDWEN